MNRAEVGVVFILSAVAFFGSSLPFSTSSVTALCGQAPPDVRFYSSTDDLREFFSACGPTGRAAYQNLQIADLFYPAISGIFLAAALAMTLVRLAGPGSRMIALAALPLVGSAFDYLENTAARIVLTAHPSEVGLAANLLGIASIGKQAVSWASWVLLVITVGLLTVRFAHHRLRRSDVTVDAGSMAEVPTAPRR